MMMCLFIVRTFTEELAPFEIASENIDFGEQLGEGQFGKVLQGMAKRLPPHVPPSR